MNGTISGRTKAGHDPEVRWPFSRLVWIHAEEAGLAQRT